ncbi:MAG: tRNA (cytidine(34)-2'-O)-methyltransferase, partial [Oscillospiraceae bacterium]|nr:tRNA (cytidine(34)-2'-O)-methyltransferase [Oscillospiraceae bacterium]
NLVLVEPRIAMNTGNIARTCAAVGAALHIVRPMGFEPDDTKLKRAGLDYWHLLNLTYYESMEDFFRRTFGGSYFYYTTKAPVTHSDAAYPDNAYLVFGREDKGLPEDLLLQNPQSCVRIPMIGKARSLNLSNAVAVAAYEALRQWGYPELECQGKLREHDRQNQFTHREDHL